MGPQLCSLHESKLTLPTINVVQLLYEMLLGSRDIG